MPLKEILTQVTLSSNASDQRKLYNNMYRLTYELADINTVHILHVKYIVPRVYKINPCIITSKDIIYKISQILMTAF